LAESQEAKGHLATLGAERAPLDVQRATKERLGVQISPLGSVEDSKIVQSVGDGKRIESRRTLDDRDRATVELFGLDELALSPINLAEVVQRLANLAIVGSTRFLVYRECLPPKTLFCYEPTLLLIKPGEAGQVVAEALVVRTE